MRLCHLIRIRNGVHQTSARKWLHRLIVACCLLLATASTGVNAWVVDHIVERAWLDDPERTLDWPTVQDADGWKPFTGVLSRGYGAGAIWIRLRIDPERSTSRLSRPEQRQDASFITTDPSTLILLMRPVYVDEILIYQTETDTAPVAVIGDHYHPTDSPLNGLNFYHVIDSTTGPFDVYLRLTSTSTRQLLVDALSPRGVASVESRQQILFGLYLTMIALLSA